MLYGGHTRYHGYDYHNYWIVCGHSHSNLHPVKAYLQGPSHFFFCFVVCFVLYHQIHSCCLIDKLIKIIHSFCPFNHDDEYSSKQNGWIAMMVFSWFFFWSIVGGFFYMQSKFLFAPFAVFLSFHILSSFNGKLY